MELLKLKNNVLRFYNDFICNYIIEDLKLLMEIRPESDSGKKGCTIPTAMLILSSMEFLGYLLNIKARTNDCDKNITYFINFENHLLFPEYYDEPNIKKIILYRHAMMHRFFPSIKNKIVGICKCDNETLFVVDGEIESLNVDVLSRDFEKAINKLKSYLDACTNYEIFESFYSGLEGLDDSLDLNEGIRIQTTINPGIASNK